ncbi:unnamed protein product [Schistosoma curassoni]|uniref:Uncharacterized protein n=1 Tax=Schistosoma curassoni TaxID=6186 RepID=A0A183L5Y8_9TREM|nr:unnamed protein product [Schistosoma curassoni]
MQQQMQEKTTNVAAASPALSTSDPLTKHYQQQITVGENKPDTSVERDYEEVLEMDRTHVEERTQLHQKASPHLESSRPKEKIKEHNTPQNGDRYEKNEQELDRTRKEGREQSGLENAGRRPTLHCE